MTADFRHIETWIFDLDNTLYPKGCDLFTQVDKKMSAFIAEFLNVDEAEARRLQKLYYKDYGTTLFGLMSKHGLDPNVFLEAVHDIDLSVLSPAPALAQAIGALPGRKVVFTNGSRAHAENVCRRLEIEHVFHDMIDIADNAYVPKPHHTAYQNALNRLAAKPAMAALFEDLERNLVPAHALGMTTILVVDEGELEAREGAGADVSLADHIHHITHDLVGFLNSVHTAPSTA